MKKSTFVILIHFFLLLIFSHNEIIAQYSPDPVLNFAICDTAGEQGLTKNAPTNDGGVYISWFDNRSGSYALYLQKLDAAGNKLFPVNGLLISNNPQSSSLVDYDLKVDAQNNAILAFTDTRNGTNINPFAYKISPSGQFLWGPNGVTLADTSTVYQANPKVEFTTDGSYYFVWFYGSSPKRIAMQRLNSDGVKQFAPAAIYLNSSIANENYDWPWHVASDNGSIILMWAGYSGSFISPSNYKLYSQKFSSAGSPLWGASPNVVYSLGRVSGFYTPRIFSDGSYGAVYCWQDDRNATNTTNSYVQRQKSDGTFLFPVNGSVAATNTTNVLRFAPSAAVVTSTNETYMYWQQKNSTQSLIGISGQKYDSTGAPKWDAANGLVFKVMDGNSFSSMFTIAYQGKIFNFYLESITGGNSLVKAFCNDAAGAMQWQGGIVLVSSAPSNKIRSWTTITSSGMFVSSWEDERNDGGGIYAQNLFSNGNTPVELTNLTSTADGNNIIINWTTATETNNKGFAVKKMDNGTWKEIGFVPGNGTSTSKHNYSFTDINLEKGTYYYRLAQKDFDGTVTYSQITETEIILPGEFSLTQNYPNPFNPSTVIKFNISKNDFVTLKVYNTLGREVALLVNVQKEPGVYEVKFDASKLSSGVYFYELKSGDFTAKRKMMLIK